jgi:hypothetical protein
MRGGRIHAVREVCFPEQLSFKGTSQDRQRLEALCQLLEQTSGEVLRSILREKAAEVLSHHRKEDAADVSA